MKAFLRQIRVSPKKANLVASLVRNKNAQEAVDILKFTPKKSAPVLRKLIKSAMANAETNFKQNVETLYIKEIIVTEGPTYKRRVSISKGRVHPILKRTSHITVKLAESDQAKKPMRKATKAEEAQVETMEKGEAKPVKAKKTTKTTKAKSSKKSNQ